MENQKMPAFGYRKNFKNFIGKVEKNCNKCGFVTFCLRVLYKHKYKCRGQLLGPPIICSFCKRRFNFLNIYLKHKRTCVKYYWKKSLLIKNYRKNSKKKQAKIVKKAPKKTVSKKSLPVACPLCFYCFDSLMDYKIHVKKGLCVKSTPEKLNCSARKSFNKSHHAFKGMKAKTKVSSNIENLYAEYHSVSKHKKERYLSSNKADDTSFMCLWCKSIYPSKKLLLKHVERNYLCAEALFHQNAVKQPKKFLTARKTVAPVVARKSFSYKNHRNSSFNVSDISSGSARKTLRNSFQKQQYKVRKMVHDTSSHPLEHINQCPVCYEKFPDSFNFFQHQKKMNHWGKATKSASVSCKCPFCEKEFFHVRARNAHLRNHADRSEEDIELFLKSSTCQICSQIFVSEAVKQQHMKLEHSNRTFRSNQVLNVADNAGCSSSDSLNKQEMVSDKFKHSPLPSSIKRKLKQHPQTCPICSKTYINTYTRDKHFQENHLELVYQCKFCSMKLNKGNLTYHMQQCHNENLQYQCLECKTSFAKESHVLQHAIKFHSDQDPKSLVSIRSMKSSDVPKGSGKSLEKTNTNDDSVQEKESSFYCDICNISYQKLCGLQRHRQSKIHRDTLEKNLDAVHKSLSDLPPSPPPMPKTIIQPEILTCAECSEEFTTMKDFVPHRLSHFSFQNKYLEISEISPYVCEVCSDVLDSHSKVQHHLFWHLQLESSGDKNSLNKLNKNDSIMPDRLSGQHVARKSFAKQNSESVQEVTIDGIKKPLFTCESCNIGFTTKSHYNVHIRKFCRMKKTNTDLSENLSDEQMNIDPEAILNKVSEDAEKITNSPKDSTEHCNDCNCLFSSSTMFELHTGFCVKYTFDDNGSPSVVNNIDLIKSAMKLDCAVAGCVTCGLPFDNLQILSEHMNVHGTNASHSEMNEINIKDSETSMLCIVHCTVCNCLFSSSDVYEIHKEACNKYAYTDFNTENSNNLDFMKSDLELKCALTGCVSCGLLFNDFQTFTEHMLLHQSKPFSESSQTEAFNEALNESDLSLKSNKDDLIETVAFAADSSEFLISDLAESCSESVDKIFTSEELNTSHKSLDFTSAISCDTLANENETVDVDNSNCSMPIISMSQSNDTFDSAIDILRKNFSQLLCLLISDPELMQRLGYGEQLVDNVLTNVLYKMGHLPVDDDGNISDLDRLRKNIQILLDVCLKDQVMELIANGKTSTDDIVVEALKMFGGEENIVTSQSTVNST